MSTSAIGIEISPQNVVEKEFMRALVNRITSIDDSITCPDDPDHEYDVETVGSDHVPTFRIYADGVHFFTISRNGAVSARCDSLVGQAIINGTVARSQILRWGTNVVYDAADTRKTTLAYIVTDDFYLLNLHGTASWGAYQIVDSVLVKSHDHWYGANQFGGSDLNTANYVPATIFNLSNVYFHGADNSAVGKFCSRFAYKSMPGYIDYVKNSIYLYDNNGVLTNKVFDLTPLYDCSEVTVGSTLALEDGRYMAVGTHQLVKVLDA